MKILKRDKKKKITSVKKLREIWYGLQQELFCPRKNLSKKVQLRKKKGSQCLYSLSHQIKVISVGEKKSGNMLKLF